MILARTLIRNVASNWAGYTSQVAVAFFLTPYVVHSLGEARYGIWTLVVSLTGYYGLLDLGIAAGINQYLTRYLATDDSDGLNRTASSGFVALTCCGFVVVLISIVLALNVSVFFQVPPELTREATLVILITGASVGSQFVFLIYSAVFTAVQRFDLSNAIGIGTRILSAGATIICLDHGYGLIGVSIAVASTNLIDYGLRWHLAGRLLPTLKISPSLVSRESLRKVIKFGAWTFVTAGSKRLILYTDSLLIPAFMPIAAVTPFAIATSLRSYFEDIFARVGFVFGPAATELDAQGDQAGLRKLYLLSSKFMFLGSIVCGSVAICWARDFFRIWLGTAYAEPANYPDVASLFRLLIMGSMIGVAQRIGYQVLIGMRKVRLLALLFATEGLSNLLLSVALIRSYGLIGVALGSVIPGILFQGILQPFFVCRSLQISLNMYCRQVLLRPTVALLAVVSLLPTSLFESQPDDWISLFLSCSLTFAVTTPIVLLIGLNKAERDLLLVVPTMGTLSKLNARFAGRRRIPPAVKDKLI